MGGASFIQFDILRMGKTGLPDSTYRFGNDHLVWRKTYRFFETTGAEEANHGVDSSQ